MIVPLTHLRGQVWEVDSFFSVKYMVHQDPTHCEWMNWTVNLVTSIAYLSSLGLVQIANVTFVLK